MNEVLLSLLYAYMQHGSQFRIKKRLKLMRFLAEIFDGRGGKVGKVYKELREELSLSFSGDFKNLAATQRQMRKLHGELMTCKIFGTSISATPKKTVSQMIVGCTLGEKVSKRLPLVVFD